MLQLIFWKKKALLKGFSVDFNSIDTNDILDKKKDLLQKKLV